MDEKTVVGKGLVERIGIEGSVLTHKKDGKEFVIETPMPTHNEAVKNVFDALVNEEYGLVESIEEIGAIGHRIVHGGEITDSTLIDEQLKEKVREYAKFAPLHNPAGLAGVEACETLLPGKPNVAVFDTSFHQTMPASSYMYGLPYETYEKHGIRKYGFHGTSHKYVTKRTAEILGKNPEDLNVITVHLGNGSSLAAVKNGKSIDTTMGLTPLEGLIMGTRSGDLDPAVLTFLMQAEDMDAKELDTLLNKESGVLGISGVSSDFRDLEEASDAGNERATLALDMFIKRTRRFLGAYLVELGKVDAISFAGGIGENSDTMRASLMKDLESFGIVLDEKKNDGLRGKDAIISSDDSKVKVLVVPTDEELMIAMDTLNIVEK